MTELNHRLGSAMQRLSSMLLKLTEDEIEKLADPTFDIEIKFVRRRGKAEPNESSYIDLAQIASELTALSNRSDALEFLNTKFATKKSIEQIARHLDIPIQKQDKAEVLRDKVVEATVGARIRSEAIKGLD